MLFECGQIGLERLHFFSSSASAPLLLDDFGRARLTKFVIAQLLLLRRRWAEVADASSFSLTGDLRRTSTSPLPVDHHFHTRRRGSGRSDDGRLCAAAPIAVGMGVAIATNRAPSVAPPRSWFVASRRRIQRRLGRKVLPAANLAQAPQHFLKPREACFVSAVLPRRSAAGQGAIITLSAGGTWRGQAPAACAAALSNCQISSVMNGITGCKQPQQRVERVGQHRAAPSAGRRVLQPAFDHLHVKAAELVPGELVQQPRRVGEVIARPAPP